MAGNRVAGIAKTEKYIVECYGVLTKVYDNNYNLKYRFNNMRYAYSPLITPNDILWVKSTSGHICCYNLKTGNVIKKWKGSKRESQDGNILLSIDGQYVIALVGEYEQESIVTHIKYYDIETCDFVKEEIINRIGRYIDKRDDTSYYFLNVENYSKDNPNKKNNHYISVVMNGLIVEEKEIDFETWTVVSYFLGKKFAGGIENQCSPFSNIYRNINFDIDKIYSTGKLEQEIDLMSPQRLAETLKNILKENNIKK